MRTKEALQAKRQQGIKLGKPKGTLQKSKFDKDVEKIKELLGYGLSARKLANVLGYSSHIALNTYYLDTEELDQETRLEVMNAVALLSTAIKKLYKPDGISVIQNGGYFNDVNHYHMHVFPRYKNDGFSWVEPAQLRQTTLTQTAINLMKIINERKGGAD